MLAICRSLVTRCCQNRVSYTSWYGHQRELMELGRLDAGMQAVLGLS